MGHLTALPIAARQPESVRERLQRMTTEIRDTDLAPARACVLLAKLTALMGNIPDLEERLRIASEAA